MVLKVLTFLVFLLGCACTAPAKESDDSLQSNALQDRNKDKRDLNAAASSYTRGYNSNWIGSSYPGGGYGGHGVTGYGIIDDKYNSYYSGYDTGYSGGNPGYGGYNSYNSVGLGHGSYSGGNPGYGGYNRYNSVGLGHGSYSGYNQGGYGYSGGYGGYGGYSGNGGLNSYVGYNSPDYQGSYHLGHGYYNRRPYGNIYSNGITPNLVTGYRGYSRR